MKQQTYTTNEIFSRQQKCFSMFLLEGTDHWRLIEEECAQWLSTPIQGPICCSRVVSFEFNI